MNYILYRFPPYVGFHGIARERHKKNGTKTQLVSYVYNSKSYRANATKLNNIGERSRNNTTNKLKSMKIWSMVFPSTDNIFPLIPSGRDLYFDVSFCMICFAVNT